MSAVVDFFKRNGKWSNALWSGFALLLLLLLLKALGRVCYEWDFLVYHLPFALRHYGLTSFVPLDTMVVIYDSFPPLSHLIQGLFIYITGYIPTANLIGFLALGGLLYGIRVLQIQFEWPLFIALILSVPLIVLHLPSGYNDLFTGCWVALNYIALCTYLNRTKGQSIQSQGVLVLFVISLGLGMLSKYQAWPFLSINSAIMGLALLLDRRLKKQQLVGWLVLVCAALLFWPVRNTLKFHNPTYPLRPPIFGHLLHIEGADTSNVISQQPKYLHNAGTVRRFVESSLELNRFQTSTPLTYSLDQGFAEGPNTPHFRMGGWSVFTMVLMLAGVFWAGVRHRSSRLPVGILCLYVATLLFIPQSHEMRYWLFVPMAMAFIIASSPMTKNRLLQAVILLNCVFHTYILSANYVPRLVPVQRLYPPDAVNYVQQRKADGSNNLANPECIKGRLPMTIFWSGKNFNEVAVKDCTF